MGFGEWAALATALMWTLSSLLWGRIDLSAITLNLCKNFLAIALILVHLSVLLVFTGEPNLRLSSATWGWLGLSGLIGIVVGDTFYFRSIQILGPRLAMMTATTSPIFAAILGWLLLNESLRIYGIIGIILVVVGVTVVVADRKAKKEFPGLFPGRHSFGIALGLLAAVCQAIGGVTAKKGMSFEDCDPLVATLVRIVVAAIATLVVVGYEHKMRDLIPKIFKWKIIRVLVPATAIGSWLGIWLSQIAFKATDVAVAQTLMSTCPLFAIPFVRYIDGHRISALSIAGTMIAILGIYLTVK
jgi:drug/metabolite transporter (DMT)-like permease